MNYRPILVIAFLLAMGTAAAEGQRHHGGPDIDQLATLLDLDDYQAQEVERIMTAARETAMARREEFRASGERPDRETRKALREEMQASVRGELETVLTAEQLEKLDVLNEMRGSHKKRGRGQHDAYSAHEETS